MLSADSVSPVQDETARTEYARVRNANVLAYVSVFLNGEPREVGTEETNLGSLVADANLRAARLVDPMTIVSISSASAFRGSIGSTDYAGRRVGKPQGTITQFDVESALAPNQGLSLITISAAHLLELLEHGVAAYAADTPSNQFPQVSGLRFSFDPSRRAQVLDGAGAVMTPGERVRNVAITDADGNVREVLVRNGQVLGDPDRPVRVVVPDALADGGDGYRLDLLGTDRIDLRGNPTLQDGAATFADKGTEHDALAEHLKAGTLNYYVPLFSEDHSTAYDQHIQNLSARTDTALFRFPISYNLEDIGRGKGDFLDSTFIVRDGLSQPKALVLSASDIAGLGAPVAGERNYARIVDPALGASIALPAGFEGLIADGRNAVTLTASTPGAVLIGSAGQSTLTTTGTASTLVAGNIGTSMLAQGGGDTFYGGTGDDSMAGGGTFFTGAGNNLVSLDGTGSVVRAEGRDTIFTGLAGPANDTIGATAFSKGAVVFAGAGRLTFINADAPSTVTGGIGGSATIFGGTGGGIFQGGSAGGNRLIGGTGVPPRPPRVFYPGESSFQTVFFPFGPSNPVGNGTVTLIGGGDGDLLYANGSGQNVLVAGPGNSTLTGGADAGGSVFVGAFGTAATTVTGGGGDDIIFAGTGSLVADGGAGVDLFVFTADRPGGTTVINGFNTAQDRLALLGHDPSEATRALAAAQVADGSTTLTLVDNTCITFTGVSDLNSNVFI